MRSFLELITIVITAFVASALTFVILSPAKIVDKPTKTVQETPIYMHHEDLNKDVAIFVTGEDIQIHGYDDPKSRILFIKKANIVVVKER